MINQYASTPSSGFGGRSYYLAKSISKFQNMTLVCASYHHLLHKNSHQSRLIDTDSGHIFLFVPIKVFRYFSSKSLLRIINWFLFPIKLMLLSEREIGFKPSCIIFSSPALLGYLGAFLLSKRFSCPIYFEVRDIWPLSIVALGNYSQNNILVRVMQWVEDFAYATTSGVISNLANLPIHIAKRTNKHISFHFSPNGVSDISADEGRSPARLTESGDLVITELKELTHQGKKIVGYCGGLATANSMDIFIDSALAAINMKRLVWVIIGDGPEKQRLKSRCLAEGATNVIFYPAVSKSEIKSVLSAIDVLFLANRFIELYLYGVSPIKLPEYLESKKPIIHVTNSKSLLEDVGCWEVLKTQDSGAVVESVNRLLDLDPKVKRENGVKAYQFVKSFLDYDNISKEMILYLDF